MGRTLYGIDLDESPFGGLIEGLLTEEELEKLADGGRPDGTADDSDDRDDREGRDDRDDQADGADRTDGNGSADSTAPAERDDSSAGASTSSGADDRDVSADSFTWGDTPADSSADARDFGVGSTRADESADRVDPYSPPGAGDYGHAGADGEGDESGGILSKLAAHRSLLLKASAVLALVAVVAVIAWKYLGSVKSVVPDRLGGSSGDSDESKGTDSGKAAADSGVSPARRRAKLEIDTDEGETDVESTKGTEETAAEREGASSTEDREGERKRASRERRPAEPPSPNEDVDLGALVGLGTLALIAAVVRKFGEDRPRDPLVDEPEED